MENRIMRRLQERLLEQAQQQRRFHAQQSQYYIVKIRKGVVTHGSPPGPQNPNIHSSMPQDWQTAFANTWSDRTEHQSTLNCIFQPTRPQHISGSPDHLPFASKSETQTVFDTLRLPASYFQIAHGTAGSAQAHTTRQQQNPSGQAPERYEFIAHYISRLGDWALALSHDGSKRITSVFWSVDKKIDSAPLLADFREFQHYALHPMLVPCIMFAVNLRMNEQRRRSIKDRVQELENAIREIIQKEASASLSSSSWSDRDVKAYDHHEQEPPQSLETYFQVLHSCRKDQSSRKGRYRFWRSFVEALEEGFEYVEGLMAVSPDVHLLEAQRELRRWVEVTDKKLESLMARDEDHVCRVDNVSHMLYSLVEQRDLRVQSSIARAAQRDSEDMKFIAVLGSIFLPASLIATVLNVPGFQFATGGTLFGAYLGITIPLIGVVVLLCFARPQLKRWYRRTWPVEKSHSR